jgi:hypothetical protein
MELITYTLSSRRIRRFCATRYLAIKTGSTIAGCHLGMRRKTDFGRSAMRSLAGQSIG